MAPNSIMFGTERLSIILDAFFSCTCKYLMHESPNLFNVSHQMSAEFTYLTSSPLLHPPWPKASCSPAGRSQKPVARTLHPLLPARFFSLNCNYADSLYMHILSHPSPGYWHLTFVQVKTEWSSSLGIPRLRPLWHSASFHGPLHMLFPHPRALSSALSQENLHRGFPGARTQLSS